MLRRVRPQKQSRLLPTNAPRVLRSHLTSFTNAQRVSVRLALDTDLQIVSLDWSEFYPFCDVMSKIVIGPHFVEDDALANHLVLELQLFHNQVWDLPQHDSVVYPERCTGIGVHHYRIAEIYAQFI